LDSIIKRHTRWLTLVSQRELASLTTRDERKLRDVFSELEQLLGAVGAAKALHLLAPRFMVIWDRRIAAAYRLRLQSPDTNPDRYIAFMRIAQEQIERVGGDASVGGRNILKVLDEYNYSVFTKGWLKPPRHKQEGR
jgi:hypothetical protein